MKTLLGLLVFLSFFGHTAVASSLSTAQLLGQWAGVLLVPGGTRQVSINISQQADGTAAAVLRINAHRLDNSAMRVLNSADSVTFVASQAGCRFSALPQSDGQQLRGTWQQPGFRTVLVLARVAGAVAAPVAATAVAGEEVYISSPSSSNPEIGMGGTLRRPSGAGPFPAVLLLPDFVPTTSLIGSTALLDNLTSHLLRQGVAVLRLDDRGTGRSAALPAATSSTELAADAQSALNFLRARTGINPLRVGVLGHGTGANVALLAATQLPAPAFVVALGAAGVSGQELLARQTALVNRPGEADTAQLAWETRCAQLMAQARRAAKQQLAGGANPEQVQVRVAQEQLRLTTEARKRSEILYKRQYALLEIIRQTPDNAQAQAIVANMLKQIYPGLSTTQAQGRAGQLITPWYRSLLAFSPQAELAKVACPTLLLHGAADTLVPASLNLSALEKACRGNRQVSAQRLEGVNHNFQVAAGDNALLAGLAPSNESSPDALDAVVEWVAQRLR